MLLACGFPSYTKLDCLPFPRLNQLDLPPFPPSNTSLQTSHVSALIILALIFPSSRRCTHHSHSPTCARDPPYPSSLPPLRCPRGAHRGSLPPWSPPSSGGALAGAPRRPHAVGAGTLAQAPLGPPSQPARARGAGWRSWASRSLVARAEPLVPAERAAFSHAAASLLARRARVPRARAVSLARLLPQSALRRF